jgi:hypothetical protein
MFKSKDELKRSISKVINDRFLIFLNENTRYKFISYPKDKTFFDSISDLEINGNYYVNEIVIRDAPRKPYLDFEWEYTNEEEFKANFKRVTRKLQQDIITVFKTGYGIDITKNDILLLNGSRPLESGKFKISLHVIVSPKDKTYYYTNSRDTTSSAFHFYSLLMELDEKTYEQFLDPQVYNSEFNFRIILSAKNYKDTTVLQPIDPETLKPLDLTRRTDKLEYMLTYINKSKTQELYTPVDEQTDKPNRNVTFNSPTRTNIDKQIMKLVHKFHPSAVYRNTVTCTSADKSAENNNSMFMNFDYPDRNESCPITGLKHTGNNGFSCYETSTGVYLKCFSQHCKKSIHIGYIDRSSEFIDSAIKINSKYLLNHPDMKNIIGEWMSEQKILSIKSPMGTGKTFLINHILDKYKFSKILWISYRQTLSKCIFGCFKKYGFVNYMDTPDNLFKHDKVIVQLDSLDRIRDVIRHDNDGASSVAPGSKFNQYNLIIVDEIEGCLSHFNSPHMSNRKHSSKELFELMLKLFNASEKILLLDADIGIKTKLLTDNFSLASLNNDKIRQVHTLVYNEYLSQKKEFIITNDKDHYHDSLINDVKSGKNLCVVSMSSGYIEKLSQELSKLSIKHVLHTSKSDDSLKDQLQSVNKFWKKFQVVLYSPTIESGTDFNEEHFDKIYCILNDNFHTCNQRAFLQMCGRIRKVRDNKILCLYANMAYNNDLQPIINSTVHTYDDVLAYARSYDTLNGIKVLQDITYKETIKEGVVYVTRSKTDVSLYDKIFLHNEVDSLNRHHDIFPTVLRRLIQKSGHGVVFNVIDLAEKAKQKKSVKIPVKEATNKEIRINKLMAVDDNQYNIQDLINRQAASKLTATDKTVLERYFFKKTFGLLRKKISDDDMRKYFEDYLDKDGVLHKLELLLGYRKIDKTNMNLFDSKEGSRLIIVKDFITKLFWKTPVKFTVDKLNIDISHRQMRDVVDIDNIKDAEYYKKEKENRALFFGCKRMLKPLDQRDATDFIKNIQKILKSYGVKLMATNRKQKNGNRKYDYKLVVDNKLTKIIHDKYNSKNGKNNNENYISDDLLHKIIHTN